MFKIMTLYTDIMCVKDAYAKCRGFHFQFSDKGVSCYQLPQSSVDLRESWANLDKPLFLEKALCWLVEFW